MKHYTYKITNNLNGKYYLGRRTNKDEILEQDTYFGSGKRLKLAIKKYGIENFTKEILERFETYEELIEAEKRLITEEIIADPNCYNMALGGHGGYTYYADRVFNHTDETKEKISIANKGRPRPDARETAINCGLNKFWNGRARSEQDKHNKSIAAKRNAALGINPFSQKIKCPHCNKETDTGNAKRWHFDRCKERK